MRLRIDREALLAVLDAVHEAAAPKGHVPILAHVRLAASCRDGLTAACCDLDMLLEASAPLDGPGAEGVATTGPAPMDAPGCAPSPCRRQGGRRS